MKASDLRALVLLLAPSLGESDVLPSVSHVCFAGDGVYTYNDLVATYYKWDHGIGSFGVNGKALAALLNGWGDRELALELVKDGGAYRLAIKSGKSLTKLPTMPESMFIFEKPKISGAFTARITEIGRLQEAIDSVATSAANPVYKAVTFAVRAGTDRLMAYTTTGGTLIHAAVGKMKFAAKDSRAWVVPRLAMQQILAIHAAAKTKEIEFRLSREGVFSETDDAFVFSKVITGDVPDFEKPIQGKPILTLEGWKKNTKLEEALSSAVTVFNTYEGICHFAFDDGELVIKAASQEGSEYKDTVKLSGAKGEHSFYVNPEQIERAFSIQSLPDDSVAVFQERAVLFGNPKTFLYAASYAEVRKKEVAEIKEE